MPQLHLPYINQHQFGRNYGFSLPMHTGNPTQHADADSDTCHAYQKHCACCTCTVFSCTLVFLFQFTMKKASLFGADKVIDISKGNNGLVQVANCPAKKSHTNHSNKLYAWYAWFMLHEEKSRKNDFAEWNWILLIPPCLFLGTLFCPSMAKGPS